MSDCPCGATGTDSCLNDRHEPVPWVHQGRTEWAARYNPTGSRYSLDELTAENGNVLGNLKSEPASLALSPDLADDLRRKLRMVNASLREGMEG